MYSSSFYLLFFLYATNGRMVDNKYYKISMVSSEEDPQRPALFRHGESPVWDQERQCLFFVDVLNQNVHRLDYNTGKIHTKHIDYGQVNVVCPVAGSHRLLVAVRSALYLLDWNVPRDAALRLLVTVDEGLPDNVINEGKADCEGRFWTGTKGAQVGDDVVPDKAALFSVEQESFTHPRTQLRPVSISNGLVWALNDTVFYYIDSPTQCVVAYTFDPVKGDISDRRTIINIAYYGFEDAIPDGMTIDNQGYLWIAIMFGGTVLHVDPDSRKIIYAYKLPVSRVTSVAWGGPNLDELFLTTSRENVDLESEPLAGAIFTLCNTGSQGVTSHRFRFDNADYY